jgi:hypothetical protein
VINGFGGAGTISFGGRDYHQNPRPDTDTKDFVIGQVVGASLEYAAKLGKPLMVYVFSDGSLSASGAPNNSVDGRGKLDWMSDNQSTAAPFVLVYKPGNTGRPVLRSPTRMQIGSFTAAGSVNNTSSPAANAVNLLVETVILNYLGLHGEEGSFTSLFPSNGLGSPALRDSLTMIAPIVNGTVSNPV